ncbi:hypothetical protein EDC35_101171 [Thiobaca trueperi]|uniref:Uncharacterized protein n=1 Tax=Thiobaca trueperi TaxID=127458 RepID=A0A4R3N5X4_9GAMM|nr:hypothetical protein EDC35_101171 [Thiobaca trueperi]
MNNVLDRLAIRLADVLGLDPCVMVCRLRWLLCWRPEVRSVWREMLNRVQVGQVPARAARRSASGGDQREPAALPPQASRPCS